MLLWLTTLHLLCTWSKAVNSGFSPKKDSLVCLIPPSPESEIHHIEDKECKAVAMSTPSSEITQKRHHNITRWHDALYGSAGWIVKSSPQPQNLRTSLKFGSFLHRKILSYNCHIFPIVVISCLGEIKKGGHIIQTCCSHPSEMVWFTTSWSLMTMFLSSLWYAQNGHPGLLETTNVDLCNWQRIIKLLWGNLVLQRPLSGFSFILQPSPRGD